MLPIQLGISDYRKGSGHKAAASSDSIEVGEELRQAVLDRDEGTCAFCGFQSKKYQTVRPKDPSKKTDKAENLVTACLFCDQCFTLDKVAQMQSGMLVWLPEIDQATVNHLARAIYVARITQGPMADTARKLYDTIMNRREDVKSRIRTDDPGVLSLVLRDYIDEKVYDNRMKKLEGVRLFPRDSRKIREGELEFNQFPQMLAYWRSKDGPYSDLQPSNWLQLLSSAA